MTRLAGKVAVITGAAGGIGSAAAKLFAEEGAKLFLVDLDEAGLQRLVEAIGAENAGYAAADVSEPEQVAAFVAAAVDRFGGLDIALLNAAIEGQVTPLKDYPVELFDKVIAINVRGVWLGLKYVIPEMERRGGGSIVITSSIAGVRGRPGLSPYVTSKHAVIGMMRTAALECAAAGIRVNTVNPSPTETRMMRSLERGARPDDPEQARRDYAAGSPMGRYAEPEEIARLMLFLAGEESAYCTGSVFMIDSGRHAR